MGEGKDTCCEKGGGPARRSRCDELRLDFTGHAGAAFFHKHVDLGPYTEVRQVQCRFYGKAGPRDDRAIEAKRKLLDAVLTRFALGFLVMGALFFVSVGTIRYLNSWLFMLGLLAPMIFAVVFLYRRDPAFLEKRMRMKEKEGAQRNCILLSVPLWLSLAVLAVMLCGYLMFLLVMNQNRFASRVVEIQEGQKLIDTGLYSVVRHPMYLAMVVLYLSAALVLGSYYALIPMAVFLSTLVLRITNEEKVLLAGLPGYADYTQRVRYRLIPLVW